MHFIYTYVLNPQCVVLVWFKQPISFKNSYLDVFRDLSGRKNHAGARGCDGCCSPTLPLGSPSFCPRDPPHLLWAGLRSWSRVVFLCLRTSLSCFCFWKIVSLGIELWVGMVCISCSVWTIFLLSLACLVSPAKSAFLLFVSVVSLSLVWSSLCVGPLSLCLCSGLRLYAFITFGTSLWHSCLPPPDSRRDPSCMWRLLQEAAHCSVLFFSVLKIDFPLRALLRIVFLCLQRTKLGPADKNPAFILFSIFHFRQCSCHL